MEDEMDLLRIRPDSSLQQGGGKSKGKLWQGKV